MPPMLDAMTRRPRPITNLAPEDRVVLFPSVARLSADGEHWIVDVHGDVSAPSKLTFSKRMLLKLLARAMRASPPEIASPLFQDRITRFVSSDRHGRRIAVRIGDDVFRLPKKSRRNGHFQAAVRVPHSLAQECAEAAAVGAEQYLELQVLGGGATGQAYLIPPTGLSVISDIDDTLKHSNVACKRTLLANTFLRPYENDSRHGADFSRLVGRGARPSITSRRARGNCISTWPSTWPTKAFPPARFICGRFVCATICCGGF